MTTAVTTYDEEAQAPSPAYPFAMEKATITHVEGVDDKGYVSRTDELAVGERHEKVSYSAGEFHGPAPRL